MIVRTTPRLAAIGPWLRNAVLVLFALLVVHDAIYVAEFGIGPRLATAMTEGGHDGYWAPVSLAVGVGASLIFLGVLGLLARLQRQSTPSGTDMSTGPAYLNELASTWLRLFPIVGLLFAVQENVEHFLADGHLMGLGALIGPGSVALPVLAATTFILAALGSLVRWRIRVLEARVAAARRQAFERLTATRQPREWATIAASIAHRWILDRRLAGRAPPQTLPRNTVATA